MLSGDSMERRLQFAGILMLLGLLVEAFCLFWTRPIGFVLFLGIGGLLLALGVLMYLLAVLSRHHPEP
jgi:hypothetical protein